MLSQEVSSNQKEIHPKLEEVVKRHLDAEYQRPIRARSKASFKRLESEFLVSEQALIFDSGCGTGESTVSLARQYPECSVLGIDKSLVRLQKSAKMGELPGNCFFVRADLVDIWRLALEASWKLKRHFIFYPNPWPKKKHLLRRWHAHPVFPQVLELGGELIMRSNWRIYAEEWARSLELITGKLSAVELIEPLEPCSAFERKYQRSGHELFQVSLSV